MILFLAAATAVSCAHVKTYHDSKTSPDSIVRDFFAKYCTDCAAGCAMLSGSWYFTAPVAPYPIVAMNSSMCGASCKMNTVAPTFCNTKFFSSHDHGQGNTASITHVLQVGTIPNASVPQCTYGLNDAAYGEVDNDGKLSVVREYFDPEQFAADVYYCSRTTAMEVHEVLPRHPAFHPQFWSTSEDSILDTPATSMDIAAVISQKMEEQQESVLVVDDSNATSLCLGMMALYSHRQCEQMRAFVTPDFRFEFSGGPAGGVDFDFLARNCGAPNPPEWITVQESYVENITLGDFWDFYATASTNPTTGKPCATVQAESYRCSAEHTPDGLRLTHIHDTFDTIVYNQWAKACGLSEEYHQRFR